MLPLVIGFIWLVGAPFSSYPTAFTALGIVTMAWGTLVVWSDRRNYKVRRR